MADEGITETLYRYRTIESAHSLLTKRTLWFSSLQDFNDPFEGHYTLSLDLNPEAYRPFLREMFQHGSPGGDAVSIERRVNDYIGRGIEFIQHELGETVLEMQKQVRSTWSFCCFSRVNDDILMWSHYASSHKGCCVEVSLLPTSDLGMLQPVEYSREYPCEPFVGVMADEAKLAILAITSKSDCWSYEREVRLVRREPPGGLPISRKIIRRIIFGIKTENADKDRLMAACANTDIIFAQASRGSGYGITIKPL